MRYFSSQGQECYIMEKQEGFWDVAHDRCHTTQHSQHSVPDDWILSSTSTVEVIENTLNSEAKWINKNKKVKVLVVGCGTSSLSVDLQQKYDAFIDVTSIDISGVAISVMKKKYPSMKFLKADCCKLPDIFKKQQFDVVLDKGTADTLLFRVKRDKARRKICDYFSGVQHILSPRGHFILISPRKKFFKLGSYSCWTLRTQKLNDQIECSNMLVKKRKTRESKNNREEYVGVSEKKMIQRSVYIHHCYKSLGSEVCKEDPVLTKKQKNTCNVLISLEAEVTKSIFEPDYKYDLSPTSLFLKDVYERFEVNPCLPNSELELVEAEATRILRNRLRCRSEKEYKVADVLRTYLKCKHGIYIQDEKNMCLWRRENTGTSSWRRLELKG